MVLFPQLSYHMQLTSLSRNECHKLDTLIQHPFKRLCHFPNTTPNALFNFSSFYDLKDIWIMQLADTTTFILNQFNHQITLFSSVSKLRLFKLQTEELCSTSPLHLWLPLHNFRHYHHNLIITQLFLIYYS